MVCSEPGTGTPLVLVCRGGTGLQGLAGRALAVLLLSRLDLHKDELVRSFLACLARKTGVLPATEAGQEHFLPIFLACCDKTFPLASQQRSRAPTPYQDAPAPRRCIRLRRGSKPKRKGGFDVK